MKKTKITGWMIPNDEVIQIASAYEHLWHTEDYEFPIGPGTTKWLLWLRSTDLKTGQFIPAEDEYAAILIGIWKDTGYIRSQVK